MWKRFWKSRARARPTILLCFPKAVMSFRAEIFTARPWPSRSILENAENLLAIELLAAAEALEHRRPLKGGAGVERAYGTVRKYAEPLLEDRALAPDIAAVATAIRAGEFDSEHEKL